MQKSIHKQKEYYEKSLLNPEMQKQVEELIQQEKAKTQELENEKNYLEANLQAQQLEILNFKNQKDHLENQIQNKQKTLIDNQELNEEEKNKLHQEINNIQINLNQHKTTVQIKTNEIKEIKTHIMQLEKRLSSSNQDLEQLKQEITQKEEQLRSKEQQLIEQKNLSAGEIQQLNSEIKTLKTDINKEKVNFEVQLSLKEEEISQLKQNETDLKEQLTKKQNETVSLREQHTKTLQEITRQIDNYKNIVAELENETNNLKYQIAKNNENAKQLQQELLNKQSQINTINQELVKLFHQQNSLQQELSDLIQTYDQWQSNCEIKANETVYDKEINKGVKYLEDEKIYYSSIPFTVQLTPILKAENIYEKRSNRAIQLQNIKIIQSQQIEINGSTFYYIRPSFVSDGIYFINHNRNSWDNHINKMTNQIYWMFEFNQSVSTNLPPHKLNNYYSILQQKTNNLNEIQHKLANKQQELNKYQQEITDLISNQKSDDTLQQELNNKENHIKILKDEMQQLEIREQGFRSEIETLKLENKNLKEKYTNDLNKIHQELIVAKTETKQLEKEKQEIQDALVKNGNVNEVLINQFNIKQSQIKELKVKINILEINETQLKTIIKQKDGEIAQLQHTIQEQSEKIIKLTNEIETNMATFKQQAIQIHKLEGAIAGLEGVSGSLGWDNKELQHEIEKLKNQLETEKILHTRMKKVLDEKIIDLNSENSELTTNQNQLKNKNEDWQSKTNPIKMGAIIGALGGPAGVIAGAGVGIAVNATIDAWQNFKRWWG
jgi:epidermal growth factor receptor substrate 15